MKKAKPAQNDCRGTRLFSGARVKKDHPGIKVCAALDEVICVLGLARAARKRGACRYPVEPVLKRIQRDLMFAAGCVSGKDCVSQLAAAVKFLDKETAALPASLPALHGFLSPGANETEALLHYARAKTRTAETLCVGAGAPLPACQFLNRLSAFLFLLARLAAGKRSLNK